MKKHNLFTLDKKIIFEWIFPYGEKDFFRYSQIKNQLLTTLNQGYGSFAYPNSVHNYRLSKEKQYLCIVRLFESPQEIIACSYVREDGKRGATTVIPKFRNCGIGSALISETLRVIPRQFGEVDVNNFLHINLLLKKGFIVATEYSEVELRLGSLSEYIISWKKIKEQIVYLRNSRDNRGLIHKFILMYI